MKLFKIVTTFLAIVLTLPLFGQLEHQTCVTSSRNPWEWPGHNHQYGSPVSTSWTGYGFMKNFKTGEVFTIGGGSVTDQLKKYLRTKELLVQVMTMEI